MSSQLRIYSEKSFRKYEPFIAEVLQNYPNPTLFRPEGNPYTFLCRMRDALTGMHLNHLKPKLFDKNKCYRVFGKFKQGGDFVFTQVSPTEVYCGPLHREEEPIKAAGEQGVRVEVTDRVKEGELDARDTELWSALVLLKERGMLDTPLKWRNVSKEQQKISGGDYIEFQEIEEGLWLMI